MNVISYICLFILELTKENSNDIATLEEEAEIENERDHLKSVKASSGGVGVDHLQFSSVDAGEQKNSYHQLQQVSSKMSAGVTIAITCSKLSRIILIPHIRALSLS